MREWGQPDPHGPPVLQSQDCCLGSGQVLGRARPPEYPVRLYPIGCTQGQSLVSPQISPGVPKLSCHSMELTSRKHKTEPTNNVKCCKNETEPLQMTYQLVKGESKLFKNFNCNALNIQILPKSIYRTMFCLLSPHWQLSSPPKHH